MRKRKNRQGTNFISPGFFMILRDKKGITLIELVIVMAIIMILGLLSAVGPAFLRGENISRFSRELYGDLYRARQDAMTRSVAANSMGWGIRFANPTSYTIFEFNDNGNFQYDGAGEEANAMQRNLTSSIVFDMNGANPANNVLLYDKLGVARNPDWTLAQQIILVIRHQTDPDNRKCIVVNTNRIRGGLWDGNNCQEQ